MSPDVERNGKFLFSSFVWVLIGSAEANDGTSSTKDEPSIEEGGHPEKGWDYTPHTETKILILRTIL